MNTLLGELATYNDIQYPRYRFAFKLRKLQTSFLLQHLEIPVLQEVFHSTGVQPLPVDNDLSEAQIRSIFSEIFSSLRSALRGGQVTQTNLQEAHATCLNWFLMAFEVDGFNKATAGKMKVILPLFCGSKTAEKAKYLFSVLAKDGTLGRDGMQYFCETVQTLATCLNEIVYTGKASVDRAVSESLYHVRDVDDIEDEEEDGGLQRPWLSCFEFVKVFNANPPLNFLSWMDLWYSLPLMETVTHNVKCSVCNKKGFDGFRYQCSECSNYHMCQLCFLKGRTSEPHGLEHQVFECRSYSKSLKGLFSKHSQPKDSRVMDEPREPPTVRGGIDIPDGSINSTHGINSIGEISLSRVNSPASEASYKATELRIGSRNSLVNSGSPKRHSEQVDSMNRLSFCSTSSSDSNDCRSIEGAVSPMGTLNLGHGIGEVGVRKQAPIIPSLKRSGQNNVMHRSLQRISKEHNSSPVRKALTPTHGRNHFASHLLFAKTTSDGMLLESLQREDEFAKVNRKLSYEIDCLLKDIEPEISPALVPNQKPKVEDDGAKILQLLQEEEQALKIHKAQAELHKSKLSTDLDLLLSQVQSMHSGFTALKQSGCKMPPGDHHHLRVGSHDGTISPDEFMNKTHSTSGLASNVNRRTSIVW